MDSMAPNYDPKASLRRIARENYEGTVPTMVCHPGYLDAYILKTSSLLNPRTLEVEMALDQNLKDELESQGVEFITYADVA